ncbi:MAG: hypothetical protein QOD77_306 [Thermoplasmata archaeon]|jgi:hypothetical protein|nr:hypothetical protein [Thermoplasmata archaeon]
MQAPRVNLGPIGNEALRQLSVQSRRDRESILNDCIALLWARDISTSGPTEARRAVEHEVVDRYVAHGELWLKVFEAFRAATQRVTDGA